MATAFSQSLRSLQSDRNRISLVVLILAGLLFLGWLLWFFFSPFAVYETGRVVQTSSDGVVVAEFPLAAQSQVQIGQSVQVHLAGAEPDAAIPGLIVDVAQSSAGDQLQVVIYADMDNPNVAFLQDDLTGKAVVTVAQLSPAMLVLRASGVGSDTPPVSFEPAP